MCILGGKERATGHDDSQRIAPLVINIALNCKTLEGFAGVMRKYCSDRRGSVFSDIFIQLLDSYDKDEADTVGRTTKKDKLVTLLKNQVTTTTATKAVYEDMDQCDSLPSLDEQLKSLRRFIHEKKVTQVGLQNRERLVVYCRRTLMEDRQSRRKRNYRYFLNTSQ